MSVEIVKVTTNLPKDAVEELRGNAAQRGDNLTQGIKAAISTKLFLDKEIKNGGRVFVRRGGNELVELHLP
jgi:hypothetical protein